MTEASLLKKALRSVMAGRVKAAADPFRPGWHLAPLVGLLNDPNGFIQHLGRYHLFYQWNPLACAHGPRFWGHWSSTDLLHWRHEPLALAPVEAYETHGCYSGSAVIDNGQLTLIYTGNVKYSNGSRTAYQCLARENTSGEFDKTGPVLDLPKGYTGHVRDPKVWRHGEYWYMVLGAQDLNLQGKVLLHRSDDLMSWESLGEIAGSGLNGLGEFGYMWECPDLFHLSGREVLICCPQGVPAQSERYLSSFQAGYFVGKLNYDKGQFPHGNFQELDLGFEFYAAQTMQADDGRRLLIGWMGLPDANEFYQPTVEQGWVHIMTCPRELTLKEDKIFQQPARELQQLRGEMQQWQGIAEQAPVWDVMRAEVEILIDGPFSADFGGCLELIWEGEWLQLSRINRRCGKQELRIWRGTLSHLTILCDSSSVEIFINGGEAVMTSRYFPVLPADLIFSGKGVIALRRWSLADCVIE